MNVTQQTETFNNPETGAETGFARNLAFIIGIDNYQNGISPLKTAVNDAKKLVEVLRSKHQYQTWICLDNVATLSNLNQFLEEKLPAQVTENDRLLFYFAGHGVALNGDDGPVGYLIPQDAKLNETKSYLPMAKLHSALSKLPCRHFLGILDCCFAGAFRWSSTRDLITSPEVIYQEHYDRFIRDAAWQIITSSASDQKALDNFNLDTERGQVGNHSPFAAALLEALEGAADTYPPAKNGKQSGDGVITATELYLHLRDRVEIPTEKQRLRQTPGIWCLNKHDKGEYIFLSPSHKLNLPSAPPLDESKNPYRGLNSFEEEHSEIFFGRSKLVEKLQKFVKINPLTVVLGASGSGKSSLVKAGLIPKLKQEANNSFSPDGKMLASASDDSTVKLWDTTNGKEIKTLTEHINSVYGISFSPDGKMLASTSADSTVKLWDTTNGKEIKTLTEHTNTVWGISFSPDGKMLASASSDNTLKLWDVSTGKEIKTLTGHINSVYGISFSPHGKMLASASADKNVRLWRLDFDYLLRQGCNFVREYYKTNPPDNESDKHLCDGLGNF